MFKYSASTGSTETSLVLHCIRCLFFFPTALTELVVSYSRYHFKRFEFDRDKSENDYLATGSERK
jgi:hypothetical protein